ncbi:MaoC family dehydratase N-terminal domain-containing protein [Agrobacterium sp. MOPV5]|uniref:FAS1-like dehydratase domain-containing protein n=1 Tax=Agrobacterium leguminum TaxID=2792015 RepID=UPI0018C34D64|nr:MaoC family dehydratase N-terminal domain-containing protein [Agrobacterium leguminum]MBG0511028.1 MaoC family dehydratase N-terminal domain-containing protein [Agrobacterium leguminum]
MPRQYDIEHFRTWIGSSRETTDVITPRLANSLAAILDEEPDLSPGDEAPIGIHWCLSPEITQMSSLGPDGHPARGGFLPPILLPRRMWAGGELRYSGTFIVGDEVKRKSRVTDVVFKEGRSGSLFFVTVTHEYATSRGVALNERHDIVYRAIEMPKATSAASTVHQYPPADRQQFVAGTPTLLFRYSAVTFNGHRIHYDRDYCINEEFYDGLVVHGPLQANLMLRMAYEMANRNLPKCFTFRATAPLFDGATFAVNARHGDTGTELWVSDSEGRQTMQAMFER